MYANAIKNSLNYRKFIIFEIKCLYAQSMTLNIKVLFYSCVKQSSNATVIYLPTNLLDHSIDWSVQAYAELTSYQT